MRSAFKVTAPAVLLPFAFIGVMVGPDVFRVVLALGGLAAALLAVSVFFTVSGAGGS